MTNRYLVAKYFSSLARMEPKNVGIFLEDQGRVYARFLGEKPGGVDLRSVRSVVSHTGSYKQWVEYWKYVLGQDKTADEVLDQLKKSSRGNYAVAEGEPLFLPRDFSGDAPHRIDYLFHLLVDEFPQQTDNPEQLSLSAKCEEIVRKYELQRVPYFQREPVIEIHVDGVRQHIRPSYRWMNGAEVYFQKVSIDSARPDATQKDVTSTAWMFEKLKLADDRRSTKALIKVSDPDSIVAQARIDPDEYLALLSNISDDVINVEDDEQVERTFAPLAR